MAETQDQILKNDCHHIAPLTNSSERGMQFSGSGGILWALHSLALNDEGATNQVDKE